MPYVMTEEEYWKLSNEEFSNRAYGMTYDHYLTGNMTSEWLAKSKEYVKKTHGVANYDSKVFAFYDRIVEISNGDTPPIIKTPNGRLYWEVVVSGIDSTVAYSNTRGVFEEDFGIKYKKYAKRDYSYLEDNPYDYNNDTMCMLPDRSLVYFRNTSSKFTRQIKNGYAMQGFHTKVYTYEEFTEQYIKIKQLEEALSC